MATTRGDRRTALSATPELYSDFDISFRANPVTGSLVRVTNDDAVLQSMENIVLAMRGEWAHHPTLGSKLHKLLFEPLDPVTASSVVEVVRASLATNEPRAQILSVTATPDPVRNGYGLEVVFRTINSTTPVTFSSFIKRVR